MAQDSRLREIREAMEQYYASFEIWGISFTILSDAELFLHEWIGTKKTFFELDFSFDGLFSVADHVGSYAPYPELRRVVMLALAYAAVCDFDSPIGQFCSTELFPNFDRIDIERACYELADLLVFRELRLVTFEAGRISDRTSPYWVEKLLGWDHNSLTWQQFLEGLDCGNPALPPPTPIRPLVNELEAELGGIREEILRQFGDLDVSKMCAPLPPPNEDFWEEYPGSEIADWARGVKRFADLDFNSGALSYFIDDFPRRHVDTEAWRICTLALLVSLCRLSSLTFEFRIVTLIHSAVDWPAKGILSRDELLVVQRISEAWRIAEFQSYSDSHVWLSFGWRKIRMALEAW